MVGIEPSIFGGKNRITLKLSPYLIYNWYVLKLLLNYMTYV